MKHGPTSPALIKQPKREEKKPASPKTKTSQKNTEAERIAAGLNQK